MLKINQLLSLRFRRHLTQSVIRTKFDSGPAPPRLPPQEQEEFERLQKSSVGAFSNPQEQFYAKVSTSAQQGSQLNQPSDSSKDAKPQLQPKLHATGDGQELHPNIRRGAKPEFEGERNPITGEIGGPKTEPLRWGSTGDRGDWSYNGRVTDF